jgi:hypothetical protein
VSGPPPHHPQKGDAPNIFFPNAVQNAKSTF